MLPLEIPFILKLFSLSSIQVTPKAVSLPRILLPKLKMLVFSYQLDTAAWCLSSAIDFTGQFEGIFKYKYSIKIPITF